MNESRVVRLDENAVCTLLLNRPDKLNALDNEAFDELDGHLDDLESQGDRVNCVVLRGNGRAFCAGADLATTRPVSPETPIRKSRSLARLARLPMPVVAVVHGHCIGGGLELALAADLVLADETAQFADAHSRWGLVPAWGLTQRLPRKIGASAAKFLIFTGRRIDGAEAYRIGLVDLLAPSGHLDSALEQLLQDMAGGSRFTNREVKKLVRDGLDLTSDGGLALEHYRTPRRDPAVRDQ